MTRLVRPVWRAITRACVLGTRVVWSACASGCFGYDLLYREVFLGRGLSWLGFGGSGIDFEESVRFQ